MSCSTASAVLAIAGSYFHITEVPASQETHFWQFYDVNITLNKWLIQGREFGSLYIDVAQFEGCISWTGYQNCHLYYQKYFSWEKMMAAKIRPHWQ